MVKTLENMAVLQTMVVNMKSYIFISIQFETKYNKKQRNAVLCKCIMNKFDKIREFWGSDANEQSLVSNENLEAHCFLM